MALFLWICCGLAFALGVVLATPPECPKPECKCDWATKDVKCNGRSIANVTAKVPRDTIHYTYTGDELTMDLNAVDFSHLTGLKNLHINTDFDSYVFHRKLNFTPSKQSVFRPLRNLSILTIGITWNMSEPMLKMFSYLPNLEVLDLSYTRLINYSALRKSLEGFKDNHVLRKVVLKNTQTFAQLTNGMSFNLSDFLEPIAHCPLRTLDLSYNSLKMLYPGLLRFAENLKHIDVSSNLLTPLVTSSFFFEVILHPSIKTADFGRQGHGVNPPRGPGLLQLGLRIPQRSNIKRWTNRFRDEMSANSPFSGHANESCSTMLSRTRNACKIFSPECKDIYQHLKDNQTEFCNFLTKNYPESFAGIPCFYLPKIDQVLKPETECGGCFVFPSTGNLTNLKFREIINYDQTKLPPQLINTTKCFFPNKVESLDISSDYPLGFPDIGLSLQSPITGFENLKVVKVSHCGLTQPYFNFSASFPSLTHLDLSHNQLTLEAQKGVYVIGPPTVTELRLGNNLISKIPEKTLTTMQALETLNLSYNNIEDFTMNLSYLPNLRKLDLSKNPIRALSAQMMDQLDTHARKIKKIITVDLQSTQMLCTCNERDFVRWMQHRKEDNLHFKDIKNYLCLDEGSTLTHVLKVDVDKMAVHCLSVYAYLGISSGAAVLLAVTIVGVGRALYKKRWWFRYKYFLITKMYKQQQEQQEDAQRNYQYDAFVSYNSRDELWITEELQPKLEDEFGLRLCLHQRDFVLGGNIMEQISSSIENSRKTVLILSPNFLASTWCHWEMNLANTRLLATGQDVLLLAILSPMSKVKMSRVLKDLLEKKTYVTWTDDSDGQKLFWDKLQQAIRADRIEPYDLEHSWEDNRPLINA